MTILLIVGAIFLVKMLSSGQQTAAQVTSNAPNVSTYPASNTSVQATTAIADAPTNLASAFNLYSQIIRKGVFQNAPENPPPYSANYATGGSGGGGGGGGTGGSGSGGAGGGRPLL